MTAGKLRPVVAAQRQWPSSLRYDLFQHPRHPPSRKPSVHFQRQTFSCKHVDHTQHAKLPPAFRRIVHKIRRPFLVRSRHLRPHHTHAQQAFSPLPPQRQPGLPEHPIHPLVVHVHALRLQLHLQAPVPPTRLLPRRFHQTLAQRLIAPPALVPLTRLRYTQQLADPPLAHQKMGVQPAHFLPPPYELHPFFSITAFSMSLSRLRSATSFFSRPFSSSNCRNRCASPTLIPPYFAFHAYTVCFDTPSSRPTSAALRPASICFSAPIISTSLYFLFVMSSPSQLRDLRFSYTPVRGKWGAGQIPTARSTADQLTTPKRIRE